MRAGLRSFVLLVSASTVALASPAFAAGPRCEVIAKVSPANQTVEESTPSGGGRAPTAVQLNGQPSQDNTTFSWSQDPGDAYPVTLSDPSAAKPTFLAPSVGAAGAELHFTLTVTGCSPLQTSSIETTVTVTDVNAPPVAAATVSADPAVVNEGDLFTLDGGASSDPDGDALTYRWDELVAGSPVLLGTTAAVTLTAPAVPYPNGASFTYRLTVSDGALSSSIQKVVTVKWVNDPPVARVTCTPRVDEGDAVLLDGADPASPSTDADDGIVTYDWRQISGGPDADLAAAALSLPAFSFVAPRLTAGHGDTMVFELEVTDAGGLFSTAQCSVVVSDVTPPVLAPADVTREATSAAGAAVSFTVVATDAFDGDLAVTCDASSGATFPLGDTLVSCSAADRAGNGVSASFTISVVDTTPPDLIVPAGVTAEATGASGAAVTFAATATDLVDGAVAPDCAPASGSTFALGTTQVSCTATDTRGNTSAATTFEVNVVDTTPPTVSAMPDVTTGPTSVLGANVSFATPTAIDLVDGTIAAVTCAPPSGSWFGFGPTTVTCSATDARGNTGSSSFTVTVRPFTFVGFFRPIDNLPALNTVKNGSTVPVKWKLQGEGGIEIDAVEAVEWVKTVQISCAAVATELEAPVEATTTGATLLRYDATGMQFVFNWQTPKQASTCWRLDVRFVDHETRSAHFKLK